MFEISDLYCPITKQIFFEPVLADDGIVYEEEELINWLEHDHRSPITKNNISYFCKFLLMKQYIQEFLVSNPQLMNDRYKGILYITKSNYNKISQSTTVSISRIHRNDIFLLFNNLSDDMIIQIIDKIENIEYEDGYKFRLIHFVCRRGEPKPIKYIIDKGVDINCKEAYDRNPLYYICRFSNFDTFKYIIDKGANIETDNLLICTACEYNSVEMTKYLIDKASRLNDEDRYGNRPIQLICKYKPELLKYIVDKGVEINCRDGDLETPLHYMCKQGNIEMIKYLLNKGAINFMNRWNEYPYDCISYETKKLLSEEILNKLR